jgi:hypothetical protein
MLSSRILPVVAASLIFIVGCAQDQNNTVSSLPAASPGPAVPAGAQRASTDVLPDSVSGAFHNEFPTASVTNVVQSSAENGSPIYRVTFISNGQAGSATYFGDGKKLSGTNAPDNTAPTTPSSTAPDRSTPVTPSPTPNVGR